MAPGLDGLLGVLRDSLLQKGAQWACESFETFAIIPADPGLTGRYQSTYKSQTPKHTRARADLTCLDLT
jgi:hypothetical protein